MMTVRDLGKKVLDFSLQYEPNFRKKIKGCAIEDINIYKDIYQNRLPDFYRWFLENMAASWPFSPYISYHIQTLVKAFEAPKIYIDKGFLPIAKMQQDWYGSAIFLDLNRSDGMDAPLIYYNKETIGFSLWEYIIQDSFSRFRMLPSTYTHNTYIKTDQKRASRKLFQYIDFLGFRKVISTSKYVHLYDSGDVALSFIRPPSYKTADYFHFEIGSHQEEKLMGIMQAIEKETTWEFGSWKKSVPNK